MGLVEHGHDRSGTTALRPTNAEIGQEYFDTTIGQDLVWNGTSWQSAAVSLGSLGAAAGTGVSANESGVPIHKTVITLADLVIATTDAGVNGAHGSQKIYDFPEGHIKFLGAHVDLAVQSTGSADGIAATATYEIGLGSTAVANADAALTTTEDDILTGVAADLVASATTVKAADGTDLVLDGSTTPVDCFLNVVFAADDHGATAGEVTVNGTVTLLWANMGDD